MNTMIIKVMACITVGLLMQGSFCAEKETVLGGRDLSKMGDKELERLMLQYVKSDDLDNLDEIIALKKQRRSMNINVPDKDGRTTLCIAIHQKYVDSDLIERLLESGAKVDDKISAWMTAQKNNGICDCDPGDDECCVDRTVYNLLEKAVKKQQDAADRNYEELIKSEGHAISKSALKKQRRKNRVAGNGHNSEKSDVRRKAPSKPQQQLLQTYSLTANQYKTLYSLVSRISNYRATVHDFHRADAWAQSIVDTMSAASQPFIDKGDSKRS